MSILNRDKVSILDRLAEVGGKAKSIIQGMNKSAAQEELEVSRKNWCYNPNLDLNQRGTATPTTTSSDYNADRWYYDGTYLYYGVEARDVQNDTYSLSWLTNNTAEFHQPSATASSGLAALTTGWASVTNGGSFTVTGADQSTEHLWLRFTAGADGLNALNAVKLEIGDTATPFEVEPYAEVLRKCQRYYCTSYSEGVAPGTVTTSGMIRGAWAYVDGINDAITTNPMFPVTMRSAPTVTLYNPATGASGSVDISGSAYSTSADNIGDKGFNWSKSNNYASAGDLLEYHYTATAEL